MFNDVLSYLPHFYRVSVGLVRPEQCQIRGNPVMASQFDYRLCPLSIEEINVIYWETY